MATTVSYKEDTLTTIEYDSSATLETANTWLEDDIVIDVDPLNLTTKTVTPSTSQQVITPGNTYNTWYQANTTITQQEGSPYPQFNFNQINTDIRINGKYIRLNGTMEFTTASSLNNPLNDNYEIQFNNYTFQANTQASGAIVPVSGSYEVISIDNSYGDINYINFWKNGNPWNYCYLLFRFVRNNDSQPTWVFKLTDFTIDWTTSGSTFATYDGLSQVTVNSIPSQYIIPTGNYPITSNGTNINIAQYETVSVNVESQSTINNQNKTVTPTTSQQNVTYDNGYTGLGTVTVNAMPTGSVNDQFTFTLNTTNGRVIASTEVTAGYINSGTISGNYDIPLVPVAQRSITPSTQTQTIAAGYLIPTSGIEIEGDADLISSNILSTANIFGVQGSVNIRTYYSGSSSPSSSLGNNGDIYFESAK